ncbi:MAG: hypothetical protein HFH94_06410 [Lachnospiraceae bacterium]|jgi:hypothetical protein|nr:hypothetical protein [uncultured Acetatifactor sp.]MCI9219355.1 hypothetical protein [Lachnospiraceae bacterium]
MKKIKVNNPCDVRDGGGLSLREALEYLEGTLDEGQLTAQQMEQIEEDDDMKENIVLFCQDITLKERLIIRGGTEKYPLKIDGNGFWLQTQNKSADGICIKRGDITIENTNFRGFNKAVFLAAETDIDQIAINRCTFQDNIIHDIIAGGIVSNCRVENIVIQDCDFYPGAAMPVILSACLDMEGGSKLENLYMGNVRFRKNRTCGRHGRDNDQSIWVFSTVDMSNMSSGRGDPAYESKGGFRNNVLKDIWVEDCIFDHVGDCSLQFCTASPGVDCVMENVVVRHNIIRQCLGAIGAGTSSVMWGGECHGNVLRNMVIEDNYICQAEFDKRETNQAIGINGGRLEWNIAAIYDNKVENVVIRKNEIRGMDRGICIEATHAMLDTLQPASITNCSIRDVVIEQNTFVNCLYPIQLMAAGTEGRYDPLCGVVPVDSADIEFSILADGNSIDKVLIQENEASGLERFILATAAYVAGHTYARNNTIGANVAVKNNRLGRGNKTYFHKYHVADEILLDDAIGEQNKTLCHIKFYFTGEEWKRD